jgi:hypothetical protein
MTISLISWSYNHAYISYETLFFAVELYELDDYGNLWGYVWNATENLV